MKRVIMGFVLGVTGIFAFASTAAACTYSCVVVSQNCRRCLDVGSYTGQTCKNSGACNCLYTNYCEGLTLAQSIGVGEADEAASCSATALPTEMAAAE